MVPIAYIYLDVDFRLRLAWSIETGNTHKQFFGFGSLTSNQYKCRATM